MKTEEQGLSKTVIARDGIAIVVNKENIVDNLSFEELQKIYTGEYTNWKQVGGPDLKIVVVNREAGSGTRGAFEEIVLGKLPNTNQSLGASLDRLGPADCCRYQRSHCFSA